MGEREELKAQLEEAHRINAATLDALKRLSDTNERLAANVGGGRSDSPEHLTLAQMNKKRLDEMRGVGIPSPPVTMVPRCTSIITGATFDAKIVHGVVCEIPNYAYPDGWDRHQNEGGRVPNGMDLYMPGMLDSGESSGGRVRSPAYKQWLYESFWKADLQFYIGKPLAPHSDPRVTGATSPAQAAAAASDKAAE
jgi:hypothetical protein